MERKTITAARHEAQVDVCLVELDAGEACASGEFALFAFDVRHMAKRKKISAHGAAIRDGIRFNRYATARRAIEYLWARLLAK